MEKNIEIMEGLYKDGVNERERQPFNRGRTRASIDKSDPSNILAGIVDALA